MLRHECKRCGIEFPPNIKFLDTLPFFKRNFPERLACDPASQPFNLGNLYQYVFKEPLEGAHDAFADVKGLRRLILAVDEDFTAKDSNHLRNFRDGKRSIIDLKWVGKARAAKIEEHMQYDKYKPEGQRLIRDLRAYFRGKPPSALENFLRRDIRIKADDNVQSIMTQVLQRDAWDMEFPTTVSLKAGKITNVTDFICAFYFTCRESKKRMLELLEEDMPPGKARVLLKRYIKA